MKISTLVFRSESILGSIYPHGELSLMSYRVNAVSIWKYSHDELSLVDLELSGVFGVDISTLRNITSFLD